MLLDVGSQAPNFSAPGDDGKEISRDALSGRPAALFFYPQDDSPSCTNEAIAFSSLSDAFKKIDTRLIGISPDSVKSHLKFRRKHGLTIEVASDVSLAVIKAFGLWGPKTTFGRSYIGVERATFLIAGNGVIEGIWRNVRVRGHAEAVLAAATDLQAKHSARHE